MSFVVVCLCFVSFVGVCLFCELCGVCWSVFVCLSPICRGVFMVMFDCLYFMVCYIRTVVNSNARSCVYFVTVYFVREEFICM